MSDMPEMNLFPLFEAMADLRSGTMDERDYFAQFDAELDEHVSDNQMYVVVGDAGSEVVKVDKPVSADLRGDMYPIWYNGKWYTNHDAYQRARRENGEING